MLDFYATLQICNRILDGTAIVFTQLLIQHNMLMLTTQYTYKKAVDCQPFLITAVTSITFFTTFYEPLGT
jgi:hypothetical protein